MSGRKPKIRWPGSKALIDGPYIDVSNVIWTFITAFFFAQAVFFVLLWHQINVMGHVLFPLPSTADNNPLTHLIYFYKMVVGALVPFLQGDDYRLYLRHMYWLQSVGEFSRLGVRWTFSILVGFLSALYLARETWKRPVNNEEQVRGVVLHEGEAAYHKLSADFRTQVKMSGADFVLASIFGLHPDKPETYAEVESQDTLAFPNSQRKLHFQIVAGTRRGKTMLIMLIVEQLLNRMRWRRDGGMDGILGKLVSKVAAWFKKLLHKPVKMLIIDTPKGDYSRFVEPELSHTIGPQTEGTSAWAIARDLNSKQAAFQYWSGKVVVNEKDPFWGESARGIGTACTAELIATCGDDWSFNNLVGNLKLTAKELEPIVRKYYIESLQSIQMGENAVTSVLGTLESNTADIVFLAEKWDGFEYKTGIAQMSARLLKTKYTTNHEKFATALFPLLDYENLTKDGKPSVIPQNIVPHALVKALVLGMNARFATTENGIWTWAEFEAQLRKPFNETLAVMGQYIEWEVLSEQILVPEVRKLIADFAALMADAGVSFDDDAAMCDYLSEHDSLKDRTVAQLMLRALLRRVGFKTPWKKLSKLVSDMGENNEKAKLVFGVFVKHATHDEACNLSKELHIDFIFGCKPIFENFEIWDRYESKPRISFKEWLIDEDPEKPVFIIKNDTEFGAYIAPLIRGMLYYAKGVIGNDNFVDKERHFYVLMDEFQALGNVKEFVAAGMEMFASKQVTLMIAYQDLSQMVALYGQDFLNFLMSNTGNNFFVGFNGGESSKKISELLGKKYISKLHTSVSRSESGLSSSQNFQEHEGVVITEDEVNSKLGLDVNKEIEQSWFDKLMRNPKKMPMMRFLYRGSNMKDAYILHTPLCTYEIKRKSVAAKWVNDPRPEKSRVFDLEAIIGAANGGKRYVPGVATWDEDGDTSEEVVPDFMTGDDAPEAPKPLDREPEAHDEGKELAEMLEAQETPQNATADDFTAKLRKAMQERKET